MTFLSGGLGLEVTINVDKLLIREVSGSVEGSKIVVRVALDISS